MILNTWVKCMKIKIKKLEKYALMLVFIVAIIIGSYFNLDNQLPINNIRTNTISYEISDIPGYKGQVYIEINNNIPKFTDEDMNLQEDYYSTLSNGKVRNGNC